MNVCYSTFISTFIILFKSTNTESLYDESDPIQVLNASSFKTYVYGNDKGYLLEYYSFTCPHCKTFAPTYVQIGHIVKNWVKVIGIGAINCVDRENYDLCRNSSLAGYPTCKYFRPGSKTFDDATVVDHLSRDVKQATQTIIKIILDDYKINKYINWPNFTHFDEIKSLSELWKTISDQYNYLLIIVESDNDDITGAEIMLNVSNLNWLESRRGKQSSIRNLNLEIDHLPKVFLFQRNNDKPIFATVGGKSLDIHDIIRLISNSSISEVTSLPDTFTTRKKPTSYDLQSMYIVHETDLLLSMYNSFLQIGLFKDITGPKLETLKYFVEVLTKYFGKSDEIHEKLLQLKIPVQQQKTTQSGIVNKFFRDWSQELKAKAILDGSSIVEKFNLEETKKTFFHDGKVPVWKHCVGSNDKFRGHTCGVWQNFHALTVNAYILENENPNFDPLYVLRAIAQFVEHFLGCQYCQDHFKNMTTSDDFKMENLVKTKTDNVLYLWEAHNKVNKRLSGDLSDDPWFPKSQFPLKFLCDNCFIDDIGNVWNETNILQFMLKYYTNIIPTETSSVSFTVPNWSLYSNYTNTVTTESSSIDVHRYSSIRPRSSQERIVPNWSLIFCYLWAVTLCFLFSK